MKKAKNTRQSSNRALLNILTPIGGFEFFRNKLHIGENTCKIYTITKYPSTVEMGWLSKIANIPRAITCQQFQPVDNADLIQNLSRSVAQNRGAAMSTKDALTRQRAEKAADDAEQLIMQIDQQGETVGYMTNLIMAVAKDDDQLEKVCRKIESTVSIQKCRARVLTNMQPQGFKAIAPFHTTDEVISTVARRNVPLSTFAGGFPFASSGYTDRDGFYFAKDILGGLIVIDPWQRGGDRTNTNWVFTGVPGVGKSTAIKHLILSEYMMGTKILLVDVEREYKDLCQNLGGDWINAGGSVGKINPLQIRPVPQDDEGEVSEADRLYKDEGKDMGTMALHFKTFEIFISLYIPGLNEIQMILLKQSLEELYAKFGITWDTDVTHMKNSDFPIFSDLHALLCDKAEHSKSKDRDTYDYLSAIIREIAKGSDSFLWNGHTTINPRSRSGSISPRVANSTSRGNCATRLAKSGIRKSTPPIYLYQR